jgi:hypothetical protein
MSKKISRRLTAVAFAAALTFAGTAEAGPLSAGISGPEPSALSLAWEWLVDAWSDLTGAQSATAADSFEADDDGACGNCANSDAGWAIDPNGEPGG